MENSAPPTSAAPLPFEYGFCKTDHKDGIEIRRMYRKDDYINDEPYATRVRSMLDQLGLPPPRAEDVFRGTHHDLLFLDSHGVVIRIGPTDVQDLMNPAILQPLGWLEDRTVMNPVPGTLTSLPLTVAIYPGIELRDHYSKLDPGHRPRMVGDVADILQDSDQYAGDTGSQNQGFIRVKTRQGEEIAVSVLLDADNNYNYSKDKMSERRQAALEKHSNSRGGQADVHYNTLRDVFNGAANVKAVDKEHYIAAVQVHQPLRQAFWAAFDGVASVTGLPDTEKRQAFWDACAHVVNRPQPAVLPIWRIGKNGAYEREEITVGRVVLHRPWTGKSADAKAASETSTLHTAIAAAHEREGFTAKVMHRVRKLLLLDVDKPRRGN